MAQIHYVYAQISEGKVQNTALFDNYEDANVITRIVYGQDAFAVDISQYPTGIGDLYHDGRFWRVVENEDGTTKEEEVPYYPTQEQEVQMLKAQNEQLVTVLADMIGGYTNA